MRRATRPVLRLLPRLARPAAGLVAVALVLALPGPGLARLGPPEGSDAWRRGQHQLAEPTVALAAALEAQQSGDKLRADWLLAEISDRHPIIADHAHLLRARLLGELGRHEEAGAVAELSLEEYPDSPLQADFWGVLGDARVMFGDEVGARLAFRGALDSTRRESRRAALLEATALSEERSGLADEAATTWKVLWRLYPLSPEAEIASDRLRRFEAGGRSLRSASDWRRRADQLFRKRRNPEALAAYDHALGMPELSASDRARVRRQRAHTLFRMRRYPDAVRAFSDLPQKEDVPLWRARSLARAGDVANALKELERIGRRRDSLGVRASFLAALLLDGRDREVEARRKFERIAANRAMPGMRASALWRLGWGAYREGRMSEAIGFLDRLTEREQDPIAALRPRYWKARALEKLGDPASLHHAQVAYQAMAREFPLTYYGWRARTRLLPALAQGIEAPAEPDPPSRGSRRIASEQVERFRILLQAGLRDEALQEMRTAARRARSLEDRLDLAELFSEARSYQGAQRLIVDAYVVNLARGPAPRLEELWWHAWPAAFFEQVSAATERPDSVDPALVLSIMREESGFRPAVVSPVGARGLMQIMDYTGEKLAADLGEPSFDADDLFDPATNIRFGAFYLSQLSAQFDGQLSAAIASYNAGPERVSEWVAQRKLPDDDEWVESIPFEQTRSYVKRVLRSLQAYRLLY